MFRQASGHRTARRQRQYGSEEWVFDGVLPQRRTRPSIATTIAKFDETTWLAVADEKLSWTIVNVVEVPVVDLEGASATRRVFDAYI